MVHTKIEGAKKLRGVFLQVSSFAIEKPSLGKISALKGAASL